LHNYSKLFKKVKSKMADAEQLWIIIHNNVIYAIFGIITKENFNPSYSAPPPPIVRGQLYSISVDWSQTVRFSAAPGGGLLRSVCYRGLIIPLTFR
jgi:hypothetical protein